MSAIQQFLATLVTNARKPGAIKSIAGQLAIAYGSNMVMETAAAAEERAEAANAVAEKVTAATRVALDELQQVREMTIEQARQHAVAAVRRGDLDSDVRLRAADVGMRYADEATCANCAPSKPVVDAQLVDDEQGPAAGLLAGDGSDDRPYREVDTIASVLDEPAHDGDG